jgi:hypothetical protein
LYDAGKSQYKILNDKYLLVLADMKANIASSSEIVYATIYDYTKDIPIEVATVPSTGLTRFTMYGDTLVATDTNYVAFYDLTADAGKDGLILPISYILPFDPKDARYNVTLVSTAVYYLGGTKFVISARHEYRPGVSAVPIYDYEMLIPNADGSHNYDTIKSYVFDIKERNYSTRDYKISTVANKYSDSEYRARAAVFNLPVPIDTAREAYNQPFFPVSSAVKDGYSVVYYYYSYLPDGATDRIWYVSFFIMDENAQIIQPPDSVLFPIIYVDGTGVICADFDYEYPPDGADWFDYYGTRNIYRKNDVYVVTEGGQDIILPDKYYQTAGYNDGVFISYNVQAFNLSNLSFLAATAKDGTVLADYEYYELSFFTGEYAIGSVMEKDETRTFYRIDRQGNRVKIGDTASYTIHEGDRIFGIKNGIYITEQQKAGQVALVFGLKNNKGEEILAPCESISVLTLPLYNGFYLYDLVFSVEDGSGVAYRTV